MSSESQKPLVLAHSMSLPEALRHLRTGYAVFIRGRLFALLVCAVARLAGSPCTATRHGSRGALLIPADPRKHRAGVRTGRRGDSGRTIRSDMKAARRP